MAFRLYLVIAGLVAAFMYWLARSTWELEQPLGPSAEFDDDPVDVVVLVLASALIGVAWPLTVWVIAAELLVAWRARQRA